MTEICGYSAVHKLAGVPATVVVRTGVGDVSMCENCRALYGRLADAEPVVVAEIPPAR